MTTKFWKPIGSSKLIRHPRWDIFSPVNCTGHGVPPPPSTGRLKLLCQCFYPSNARIDPTTQELFGEICTCRYTPAPRPPAGRGGEGPHLGVQFITNGRQSFQTLYNKSFECVSITDDWFPDGVLRWITPKCTHSCWVKIRLEQFNFYFNVYKWSNILPTTFFLFFRYHYYHDSLMQGHMTKVWKLIPNVNAHCYRAWHLSPIDDEIVQVSDEIVKLFNSWTN